MKISDTSKRLREIMEEQNLKQVDILRMAEPYCQKYGISLKKNDLSQYISGRNSPGSKKLTILALSLGVSEAWLMGYDIPKRESDNNFNYEKLGLRPVELKKFPMIGNIACGEPIEAIPEFETFVEAASSINADFCLTAKGDSMINANIHDGDIVFIKSGTEVINGKIYAVQINCEVTLKRTYIHGNTLTLVAENPAYDPIIIQPSEADDIKILGRAVAAQFLIK